MKHRINISIFCLTFVLDKIRVQFSKEQQNKAVPLLQESIFSKNVVMIRSGNFRAFNATESQASTVSHMWLLFVL